ncbi:MAG: sugar phosphate isomerase/epimerase [Candidatus Latescibacteria bacterium]|nr:sugar phosphate isomerase/epimerase [Candidatus Latescibacterota bacterium]
MKKSINQWAFAKDTAKGCMELAKDAGFEAIELALAEDGDITLNSTETEIRALRETADRIEIELASLATGLFWSYSLTSNDADTRKKALDVAKKELEVAAWLGVDAILVVPGAVGVDFVPESEVIPYDVAYKRALAAIRELAPVAEQLKVAVCVENVWNKFLLSPLEMRDFVDAVDSEYVGVYFDVGNVIPMGYPEHWIQILGKRIKRVHFKDFRRNVGTLDGFVDLLEGDVNWPGVMAALRRIGYNSYATAEMIPPYTHHPEALVCNTSRSMDYILKR